ANHSMTTDRPGAVRIKAAAARAASVAPETAIPTSACLRAGASFDTVAGHSHDVAVLLQNFYDGIFMFRENLSETIGLIDLLGSIQRDLPFCNIAGEKFRCWLDVCAHAQLRCDLSGNSDVIAGNHLYLHAVGASPSYGALGIGPGRIQQRKNSQEPPGAILFVKSDANSAIATTG